MKRKRFLVTMMVAAIAGICVMTNCSKEENNYVGQPDMTKTNSISNPSNPYDSIGAMHNAAMDKLYGVTGETFSEVVARAEAYLYDMGYDTIGDYSMTVNILKDVTNNYHEFIEKQNLSKPSKDFMNTMMYGIAYMALIDNVCDYNSYRSYIVNKEDSIAKSDIIPSYDKDNLLTSTAVYRYSLYYWNNVYGQAKMSRLAKAAIIAGADAAGALVAGGQGAIVASLGAAAALSAVGEVKADVDTTTKRVTYSF